MHPRRRAVPGQPAAQPRDDPGREPLPGPHDQRGVHPDRDPRVGRGRRRHRQAVPDRERGHPVHQGRARAAGAPAAHAGGRRDDGQRQGVVRRRRRRRRRGQRGDQGVAARRRLHPGHRRRQGVPGSGTGRPPMTEPTLRIVIGTAGSGKSTIAQRLAREHAAAYLDKDAMSARFVEAALIAAGYDPGDRESNAFYRERILPLEYDSLLDVAGTNLRLGRPVVIDAPFSPYLADPHSITTAVERFEWPPVDIEVVLVRVSPATLQQRLRERGLERDRVKLDNWHEYWAEHGGRPCTWTGVRQSEIFNDAPEA